MSEEANKHKKRRLTNAVVTYFSKIIKIENIFYLDGNPYDVEFSEESGLTYKVRSVIGEVSQCDRTAAEKPQLNTAIFRIFIANRREDNNKDFDLIRIK